MEKKFDSALTRQALETFSHDDLVNISVALADRVTALEEQLAVAQELKLLAKFLLRLRM